MDWTGVREHMQATELSSAPPKDGTQPTVTGDDFEEANFLASIAASKDRGALYSLERWVDHQVTAKTRADLVPNWTLRQMGSHPIVYLGEYSITGLARRPNLFHVATDDEQARAETEAWLWPLLPSLVSQIVRAYVYGSSPIVFDWRVQDLAFEAPTAGGKGNGKPTMRQRTRKGFAQIVASHDLWLDEVHVVSQDGRTFEGLEHGNRRYPVGRSMLAIWDRQFGSWLGESARRRASSAWLKSLVFEVMQARYLERSVDAPRVIYAPDGTIKDAAGNQVSNAAFVRRVFASLRNGGVASLPFDADQNGNQRYKIELLNLPDRSDVWEHALSRFDAQILTAYLVPPGIAGVQDVLSGGAARVTENLFGAFLEMLLEFVAAELTQIVGWVWEANNKGTPPDILPNRLPDRVQKLYLEVLKLVGGEKVGARVDVNALLGQLDVAIQATPDEPATGDAPARPPGRPRDATGDRERRREDSPTPEGREDTGAQREEA